MLGADRLGTSSVWGPVAFGRVPNVGGLVGLPPPLSFTAPVGSCDAGVELG